MGLPLPPSVHSYLPATCHTPATPTYLPAWFYLPLLPVLHAHLLLYTHCCAFAHFACSYWQAARESDSCAGTWLDGCAAQNHIAVNSSAAVLPPPYRGSLALSMVAEESGRLEQPHGLPWDSSAALMVSLPPPLSMLLPPPHLPHTPPTLYTSPTSHTCHTPTTTYTLPRCLPAFVPCIPATPAPATCYTAYTPASIFLPNAFSDSARYTHNSRSLP